MIGVNSWDAMDNGLHMGSYPPYSLRPYPLAYNGGTLDTDKSYGSAFWAGLPIAVTAFDPLNIEVDINYGYVESMGRYDVQQLNSGAWRRGDPARGLAGQGPGGIQAGLGYSRHLRLVFLR